MQERSPPSVGFLNVFGVHCYQDVDLPTDVQRPVNVAEDLEYLTLVKQGQEMLDQHGVETLGDFPEDVTANE